MLLKHEYLKPVMTVSRGFPGGSEVKSPPADAGDPSVGIPGCDPGVGKISRRRKWQPTPLFLPGNSHGPEERGRLQSMGLQRVRRNSIEYSCSSEQGPKAVWS